MEEGGEEEDMDLDDDASLISRVPPSGSEVASDSKRTPLSPLLSSLTLLPLLRKRTPPYQCFLLGRTLSQPSS